MDYLNKYLKYKNKYLKLKNLKGGVLSEKSKIEITKWREPPYDSITLPRKSAKDLFKINSKLYDYISSLALLKDNTYIFDNLSTNLELTSKDFNDILLIYSYYKKNIPQNNISEITDILNPKLTKLKYNHIEDKLQNISKIIMLFFLLIFSKNGDYKLKIRLAIDESMYYEINKNNNEMCHLSIHFPKSTVGEINNEIHLLLNNNQRINFFYDTDKKIVGKAYFTSDDKFKDIVYESKYANKVNVNLEKYKNYINFFEIILTIVLNNFEITRGAEPIAVPLAASTAKADNSTSTYLEINNVHMKNKEMIIKNINKKTNINLYSIIINYSNLLNNYNKSFVSIKDINDLLSECLEIFINNIKKNKFVLISYMDIFLKTPSFLQKQNDFINNKVHELKTLIEKIDLTKILMIKKKISEQEEKYDKINKKHQELLLLLTNNIYNSINNLILENNKLLDEINISKEEVQIIIKNIELLTDSKFITEYKEYIKNNFKLYNQSILQPQEIQKLLLDNHNLQIKIMNGMQINEFIFSNKVLQLQQIINNQDFHTKRINTNSSLINDNQEKIQKIREEIVYKQLYTNIILKIVQLIELILNYIYDDQYIEFINLFYDNYYNIILNLLIFQDIINTDLINNINIYIKQKNQTLEEDYLQLDKDIQKMSLSQAEESTKELHKSLELLDSASALALESGTASVQTPVQAPVQAPALGLGTAPDSGSGSASRQRSRRQLKKLGLVQTLLPEKL